MPVQQPGDLASCAVCERTILPGERIAEYVAPDGERVGVCALCKPRAEASDWIPAEHAGRLAREPAVRRRRGLGLRQRLNRASEAASARLRRPEPDEAAPVAAGAAREPAAETARQAPRPRAAEPPRREPQQPLTHEGLMRLALDAFNTGPGPRKVAGLTKSLGEPRVSVRADGAAKALVTVAWEISWYQWEVSVDGGDGKAREVRKGSEVSELEPDERGWNATATPEGTLRFGLAAASSAGGPDS